MFSDQHLVDPRGQYPVTYLRSEDRCALITTAVTNLCFPGSEVDESEVNTVCLGAVDVAGVSGGCEGVSIFTDCATIRLLLEFRLGSNQGVRSPRQGEWSENGKSEVLSLEQTQH